MRTRVGQLALWLLAGVLLAHTTTHAETLDTAAHAAKLDPAAQAKLERGENPYPVQLRRPPSAPLSAMAELGKILFNDVTLSRSGQQSCASCHDAAHAFGPIGADPAVLGGPAMKSQGMRAVPSLMYLERQPPFSVGPDDDEREDITLVDMVAISRGMTKPKKTANTTAQSAAALVPQGGLFWDGRSDSLQDQALGPLLNPVEMDGGSVEILAGKLSHADYSPRFVQLFGAGILSNPALLVSEAQYALARYQIEDKAFHPYSSKFDAWLEGKARLEPAELRGYVLFNDVDKADCGGCHVDRVSADGRPPLFTDFQFESLGAPRNPQLRANADPAYFDRGVCGPYRTDMTEQTQYCGMFLTPTLRNTAKRQVFFHNGVFHTLAEIMDFYAFRDVQPEKVYPRDANGKVLKYDDMPAADVANVDVVDPPFDRTLGDAPPITPSEEQDIIAFMATLNDGWQPSPAASRDGSNSPESAAKPAAESQSRLPTAPPTPPG